MTASDDNIWQAIRLEVEEQASAEPILASFLHATILNHSSLEDSLSFHLANKLDCPAASAMQIREVVQQALGADPSLGHALRADLIAVKNRDSACINLSTPFLFFKGFHALQSYRIAHWLWNHNRRELALFLQNRISVVFAVDIHPAAQIGEGIMLDHATGIVIGETAVVENNVSIMHSVTLGGTGKECGDRHPKVRAGVLIGPGAKILGNIEVGAGAKVCAGSVVLKPVPAHSIIAGVPATVVGRVDSNLPAWEMDQGIGATV
ncbi:MAG: serine O-acetyltransferase [Gammaproteobacteria bacterium]|uniref:serine O-acetyltransferase n=1 Tax=Pseudomaricurvus alcaniphilus TaxID=1166482 RepID=UPI00140A1B74|nr:serine O-acetyltransferase [Pseudomaricurvus alcaniphilus]MBR9910746.1 serine O-acetyltransferase [Gammaproteobacteria bacterium]NHN39085.1 serine O-acetyltransferase [Pseudomaricurvus alcaniphilus]